jgi:SAM-dependent methyltransferase
MVEINLLEKYPKSKRPIDERATEKTPEDIAIAKRFGKEFFDGDRRHGYGGYSYHERFWTEVVKDFIRYYGLKGNSRILDVGCGKGFMLHDFKRAVPEIMVRGIDISEYAIEKAMDDMKPFVEVGSAKDLSRFKDKEFDLVISINTVHNLKLKECKQAIREIQRVGIKAFITMDAWRAEEERQRLMNWVLTAETMMSVSDWVKLFREVGYTGDYYWFIP